MLFISIFIICGSFILISNAKDDETRSGTSISPETSHPLTSQIVKAICNYDTEKKPLYSIKFYKSGEKFYEYSSSNSLEDRVFPVLHLEFNNVEKNSLVSVSEGIYRCKVTNDNNGSILKPSVQINTSTQSSSEDATISNVTPKSKAVKLKITPQQPVIGDSVKLEWTYDIEGEPLHIIKLYKNLQEFYRYTPSKTPPWNIFPHRDINVSVTNTGEKSVVLSSVTTKASGLYTCEVISGAPYLSAKIGEANVTVQPASSAKTRGVHLSITPQQPVIGDSVKLEWTYDIEDAPLYSIKLSKDYHEFYRYTPSETPPWKVFPHRDINVSVTNTSERSVVLSSVTTKANGVYICEVVADAPSFLVQYTKANLTVQPTSQIQKTAIFPYVKLNITPQRALIGESVKLEWTYYTEGEPIYSVNIYKDRKIFFRYVPSEYPKIKLYLVQGINVEANSISDSSLVLTSVSAKTAGNYHCELTINMVPPRTLFSAATLTVE